MKQKRKVLENEVVVLEVIHGDESLTTFGISTCIGILLHGHFGAHEFLTMYHWDGFNADFDKHSPRALSQAKNQIMLLIHGLADRIKQTFPDVHYNTKPRLDAIHIIGGEKAKADLSGTELEVETLKLHLQRICRDNFHVTKKTQFDYQNYLTEGLTHNPVNLNFMSDHVDITTERDSDEEADTSRESIASDDDDNEVPTRRFK